MIAGRSARGFIRAADMDIDRIGLSKVRTRALKLEIAWHRAAGKAVAGRARPLHVRRGVLHVRVDDPRWLEVLKNMIPSLAGRMAAACPELKIRKYRLVLHDGESFEKQAEAVCAPPTDEPCGSGPARPDPSDPERATVEIGKLAAGYLKSTATKRREGT
jgi:hypothetical protein